MKKPTTNETTLTIRRAGDLVEAIPYLIGFHPTSSLVVVGLQTSQVAVTTRLDLDYLQPQNQLEAHDGVDQLMTVLRNSGSDRAIAAVYDDAPARAEGSDLAWKVEIDAIRSTLAAEGIDLVDAVLVSQDRYYNYFCDEPECCPAQGRKLPGEQSAAAATATYAGLVAHQSRADLLRMIHPASDAERTALEPLIAAAENLAIDAVLRGQDARHTRAEKRAVFAAARSTDSQLFSARTESDEDRSVSRYAVALTNVHIRDALWVAIDARRLDGSGLWRELARRVPAPYDAAPLFLFAWANWRNGNGTLARAAAERAVVSDPEYSAARLLLSALDHGLDPRRTPRLRSGPSSPGPGKPATRRQLAC
ncbi:uncharacterized protein DUF4192 [Jatrophihabitans sp. GAS493]|uniref:DUF4192 domain-containing protein n=1 Tax=Jatrophihabitans sp. GAS493 TaxID=1907575 RepID=UPI000BB79D55|nr:DUF4192 domain-containing protein [Jatrophihabitans sp. GAS493]SOD74104.1 uncharacterized protein DUF4192 [Jatrophihabitans sp. GAS493]